MKRGIHLYIDGHEIEFDKDPQILFNYAVSDITSPAVVKNSYSKTLDVPGTPSNNRVFGSIWNLDVTGFDPGRKIPFTIYVDDEVYETGYCRLDSFKKKWNTVTYTVSFFGGLGEFMYNLSYSPDDPSGNAKKKTLADLTYRYEGEGSSEVDLDFTIDKDTVADAWTNVQGWSTKWRFLNFAPAYDGLPSDYDADKVAVYGMHADERYDDGKTYRPYEGWTIDNLPREYTGAEMREFRSYLQRPVIRAMEVVKACTLPENNGGYTVNLDPTFFKGDNPYWQDAWVTLPMLSSLDYTGSEQAPDAGITIGSPSTGSGLSNRVYEYWDERETTVTGVTADSNYGLKATLKLKAVVSGATSDDLYVTAAQDNPNLPQRSRFGYNGAVVVQLVAYDSFGNAVAGSNPLWLRSPRWGYDRYTEPSSLLLWGFDFVYPSDSIDISDGKFTKVNGEYVWNSDLVMKLTNVPPGSHLRLVTYKICNYTLGSDYSGGNPTMHMWSVNRHGTDNYYDWTWTWKDLNSFGWSIVDVDVNTQTSESIRSGALVEKNLLLATSYTPAEFLLSYCKMFGLMFRKDPSKKVIDILTRGSFYNGGVMDLNGQIDRDEIQVTPNAFDKKWYDFTLEESASEYGDDYRKQYGERYGSQTINTGYQFNSETEQVFKDNVFKGSVEALERSDAFAVVPGREWELIYNYRGYSYLIYNVNDPTDSFEVEVPQGSTVDLLTGLDGDTVYYDLFPKVQLHTADNSPSDGDGVMLLFKGMQSLVSGTKSLGYRITDDNGFMNYLNDNTPCWLVSNSDYDAEDRHLMISVESCPSFGRYIIYGPSGYITKSLDFGEPKTLYVPNAVSVSGGTLYNQCWADYIADLYSPDTRVVKCRVRWKGRMTIDDLRRFYWFDNCLWRIDKVEDWDMMSRGLTTITFVKVNDAENYGTTAPTTDPQIQVTLSAYEVPLSGGTVSFSAVTSDNGPWYADYDPDVMTVTPAQATASTTGTITVQANTGTTDVTQVLYFYADPSSVKVTITQKAYAGSIEYLGTSYPGGTSSDVVPDTGGTIYLNIVANGPWTLSGPGTMSQSSGTSTSGSVVSVNISANTNPAENQFRYTLTMPNGTYTYSPYIKQNGYQNPFLACTSTINAPASASTQTITIYDTNCEWRALPTQSWVTLNPSTGGTGHSSIEVTFSANTETSQRYCQVYFYLSGYNQVLATTTIWQEGAEGPEISVTPSAVTVGRLSGTTDIEVTSNVPWEMTRSNASVLPSTYSGQSGTTTVTLTYYNNTSTSDRQTHLAFFESGQTGTELSSCEFTQRWEPFVILDRNPLSFAVSGGTDRVTLSSNVEWEVSGGTWDSWITVSPTSGNSGGTMFSLDVLGNPTTSARTANIQFVDPNSVYGVLGTLVVNQSGIPNVDDELYYKTFDGEVQYFSATGLQNQWGTSANSCSSSPVTTGDYAPCYLLTPSFTQGVLGGIVSGTFSQNGYVSGLRWITKLGIVSSIGNQAFKNATSLKSLEVYGGFCTMYDTALVGCTSLKSITMYGEPKYEAMLKSVTTGVEPSFSGATNLETVDFTVYGVGISYYMTYALFKWFSDCTHLKTITLRNNSSADTSSNSRFAGTCLNMNSGPISGATSLTTVNLFGIDRVTIISGDQTLFLNCPNLTDIWWDGTTGTAEYDFATSKFSGCPSVTVHCSDGTYIVPSTL